MIFRARRLLRSMESTNGALVVGRYTDSSGIDHGILLKVQNGSAGVMLPLAPPSAPAQASPERAVFTEPAY